MILKFQKVERIRQRSVNSEQPCYIIPHWLMGCYRLDFAQVSSKYTT